MGTYLGLTLGGTVIGDPVKVSINSSVFKISGHPTLPKGHNKNRIRQWYQHVRYRRGLRKRQVRGGNVRFFDICPSTKADCEGRGRVIKELGLRRTDLVVTTKLFWGLRTGPNDGGLSRKQ
jgi:hypothetical protein